MTSMDGGNAEEMYGTFPAPASDPLIFASGKNDPITIYLLGKSQGG
jgi:hypothetical protein